MRGRKMTVTACIISGCHRKPFANDLCNTHNMRKHRHGNPNYVRPTTEQLFWGRVEITTENGCWPWRGAIDRDGYGHFTYWNDGRVISYRAHRYTYERLIGPISAGLQIDHLCHNTDKTCKGIRQGCPHRRCVNPAHLEPVSVVENLQRSHVFHGHKIISRQGH